MRIARRNGRVAASLLAAGALVGLASPASAGDWQATREVTGELEAPFAISVRGREILVAETAIGQITRVDRYTGDAEPETEGLIGLSGVTHTTEGLIVAVTGAFQAEGEPPPGQASVWAGMPGEPKEVLADLLAYELEHNPDGQLQFDEEGDPYDALSNPFSVMNHRGSDLVLVADGGANAVLSVSPTGEVSNFFVPDVIRTGECETRPNNTVDGFGCDSVPTGLAYGPDGHIYVSALGGEAPGEGRVYELHPLTGELLDEFTGLTAPTGVAVGGDGSIYVSELLHDMPQGEGPPPADFDPSTVGRLVRISPYGEVTTLPLPTPVGLAFYRNTLYSTAWAFGVNVGLDDMGQILEVSPKAFS